MDKTIKIAFDSMHNEILKIGEKGEYEWESWTLAEDLILEKRFEISILKDSPLNEIELSKYNILVIGSPQSKFKQSEITAIIKFIKNGGSLFAMSEQGGDLRNSSNLSEITKEFGIEFNNDRIHDKINNIKGYDYGPIISDFATCSSITFNIREFNLLLACSLNVTKNAVVIARTSKDAYIKIRTPQDKWIKKEISSLPVLAIREDIDSHGRIVAIGDSHIFSDDDAGMSLYNNKLLLNNIIDWLSEPFLDNNDKYNLLAKKINRIAEDLVKLQEKLGIIEIGPSIYNPEIYNTDQLFARIDKLETLLKKVEQKTGEEEIKYYRSRVRLQIWAIVMSFISVLTVITIAIITQR